MTTSSEITALLLVWQEGEQKALEQLLPLVYDELHILARRYMRQEDLAHTIQPTALIHEAYLRLIDLKRIDWQGRAHFYGVAARLMRNILVDHARKRDRVKRGSGVTVLSLEALLEVPGQTHSVDLLALDDALTTLALTHPQQSQLVELRYFAGLNIEETATALRISPATVKRQWTIAKSWLRLHLQEDPL